MHARGRAKLKWLSVCGLVAILARCGGGGAPSSSTPPPPPPPAITITLSPSSATVTIGQTQQFTATVTGSANTTVTWYVSDVEGGNSTVGTIDSTGLYAAPEYPPDPSTATIEAVSQADSTKSATAAVNIAGPVNEPLLVRATFFPTNSRCAYLWAVVLDEDENVVAAGTVFQDERGCVTGTQRATVLSADQFGRQRWIYTFDRSSMARSAVLAPDRNLIYVVGEQGDYPTNAPLLFALDDTGNYHFDRTCSNMQGGSFMTATEDASGIYITAYTPQPALVTADLDGNLDCANPKDVAVGDLAYPRLNWISPLNGDLVVVGDREVRNECWTVGLSTFIQSIDAASQLLWRFDFDSVVAPAITFPTGKATIADEGEEKALYVALALQYGCPSTPNDLSRYMTAKLNSSGQLLWWDLWNGDNSPTSCEAYP